MIANMLMQFLTLMLLLAAANDAIAVAAIV